MTGTKKKSNFGKNGIVPRLAFLFTLLVGSCFALVCTKRKQSFMYTFNSCSSLTLQSTASFP